MNVAYHNQDNQTLLSACKNKTSYEFRANVLVEAWSINKKEDESSSFKNLI